jgi:hypothetical protein
MFLVWQFFVGNLLSVVLVLLLLLLFKPSGLSPGQSSKPRLITHMDDSLRNRKTVCVTFVDVQMKPFLSQPSGPGVNVLDYHSKCPEVIPDVCR